MLHLQKTWVCLKCDTYLISCISKDYSINCELSAPSSTSSAAASDRWEGETTQDVFSAPVLHCTVAPRSSVTAPSYGGHQSGRLLPVKLGRANGCLTPLFWFPQLPDFFNTAHQDRHHARGLRPFLTTTPWHSSLGKPHISLCCRLHFTVMSLTAFLNALHLLLSLPFSRAM